MTERRACRVVGQPRSTQRLKPPVPSDDELALRAFLRDFSKRRPRWGWRRAAVEARKAGWRANHKRIHRLWIAEGLRVPYRKRKKPLRGIGQPVGAMCPIQPNVVWAMDFQFDQTRDGGMLKILNVVDEFTREALAHRRRTAPSTPMASSDASIAWPRTEEPRSTYALTTAPSSLPTRSPTGAGSTAPTPCSSTRAVLGRTAGSKVSTVGCAMST